jgi:hypothetical protein
MPTKTKPEQISPKEAFAIIEGVEQALKLDKALNLGPGERKVTKFVVVAEVETASGPDMVYLAGTGTGTPLPVWAVRPLVDFAQEQAWDE